MSSKSTKSAQKATKSSRDGSATSAASHGQARGNAAALDAIKAKKGAEMPYSSKYGGQRTGSFAVDGGQLTFDAEGTEGGRFHSRTAHVPPGPSGVTIGRGYDLGQHSKAQIRADLAAVGLSREQAEQYAAAAGLKGDEARGWLKRHKGSLVEITPGQQAELFNTTYEEMSDDVQRISDKKDVVEKFGRTNLAGISPAIKDTLVDLRYRGDYTGSAREKIQDEAADNDLIGLTDAMTNKQNWKNVPPDRFERRAAYLREAEERSEGAAYGWTGMPMDPSLAVPVAKPGGGKPKS